MDWVIKIPANLSCVKAIRHLTSLHESKTLLTISLVKTIHKS